MLLKAAIVCYYSALDCISLLIYHQDLHQLFCSLVSCEPTLSKNRLVAHCFLGEEKQWLVAPALVFSESVHSSLQMFSFSMSAMIETFDVWRCPMAQSRSTSWGALC